MAAQPARRQKTASNAHFVSLAFAAIIAPHL
jgi:hypothetical protein